MLTLVVERSTRRPGWALFRDATCLQEFTADGEPSLAPEWLATLHAALEKSHVSLAEVDRFVAGIGPGSFSGIRATVAGLQGMALPGGQPLLGLSSAAALAFAVLNERAAANQHTPVAIVGDARRERLWCAVYTLRCNQLALCSTTGIATPAHTAADFILTTAADLPRHLPPETVVVSPDLERLSTRLAAVLPATAAAPMLRMPSAADVGRLLLSDPTTAHVDPVPIYLHPAVAEVRT